ncbi:MAG: single-stranded-DNA-specific exonuclease RecJ, partial [Gemmatimonadota bacterium]
DQFAADDFADAIRTAIRRGETILVHGDYDVDGLCSTALLTLWLRRLGGRVTPFVPHRTRDGYDLGPAGVEAARRAGAGLIVTCDSGISAHDAVRSAGMSGIDVVVTDHHTPGSELPPAVAVVNPSRSDCDYPDASLAGAGVAFKLCQLLAGMRGLPEEELLPYLDLVALATVADLVPLRGENRVLVRYGLRALSETRRPGLLALMEVTGKTPASMDAGSVGFVLGPRLNAAGRIGDPMDALRLLITDDRVEAQALARVLEEANRERREEDSRTLEEALGRLRTTYDPARDLGVVVEGQGWHPGVVGIVASRVVERLHRPAVLIAVDGESARGSARSVPGVNLYDAVRECAPHLTRFGGHRQAAGMDLATGDIPAFRVAFNKAVTSQLGGEVPGPVLRVDGPLPLEEATEDLRHFLEYLGPFGIGNPRPTFVAGGARVSGGGRIVGGRHLK